MKFLDKKFAERTINLMLKSFFLILFGTLSLSPLVIPLHESQSAFIPAAPNTGSTDSPQAVTSVSTTTVAAMVMPAPVVPTVPTTPVRLDIPSISLSDTIIKVGTNAKGEMDVPPGNTSEVGWYDGGTVPGTVGSAVIDAHVFAAFSKLQKIKMGSDIYVTT